MEMFNLVRHRTMKSMTDFKDEEKLELIIVHGRWTMTNHHVDESDER